MAFDWSRLAPMAGNALSDLGYGLTQGNNVSSALKAAGQRTADMAQPRAQAEIMQRQEQERQFAIQQQSAQRNQTVKWLMQNNMPDLAEQFSMGMIDGNGLFSEIKARTTPAQPDLMEINGQLVDRRSGRVVGDYRDPPKSAEAPSGYRMTPSGGMEAIPGGPADPNNPLNASKNVPTLTEGVRREQKLASVMVPEAVSLLGPDGQSGTFDALSDLGNQAWDASVPFTDMRPGRALTSGDYQKAVNSLSTIVASYLYSVSGATATDQEVKRQVDMLTPKPFEAKASVDEKRKRVRQMVEAVMQAGSTTSPTPSGAPMSVPNGGVVDYTTYFGGR